MIVRRLLPVLVLASCYPQKAPAPAVPQPQPNPGGDELFIAGRYADAAIAYQHELERGERVVELQLFAIAAHLAAQESSSAMADKLRDLEHTYARSRWGRLAGVIASEIDRGTVLQQAVMETGADLAAEKTKTGELDQRIAQLTSQAADQQSTIAALRDERTKLQQQLKDDDERAAAQDTRIKELEGELAALKQVDLQRTP